MKNRIYITFIILILNFPLIKSQNAIPLKVGEELEKTFESSHPYTGTNSSSYELVFTQNIFESNASYIAVHFEKLELSKGDYLIFRNPENSRSWKYSTDQGVKQNFWSIHVYGETAIIEIFSKNKDGKFGYKINKIAKGFQNDINNQTNLF